MNGFADHSVTCKHRHYKLELVPTAEAPEGCTTHCRLALEDSIWKSCENNYARIIEEQAGLAAELRKSRTENLRLSALLGDLYSAVTPILRRAGFGFEEDGE